MTLSFSFFFKNATVTKTFFFQTKKKFDPAYFMVHGAWCMVHGAWC
jgi:hypothetical protein